MTQKPKNWMAAGGLLGVAILIARTTRTPLALLLLSIPQLIKLMQSYERISAAQRPQKPASENGISKQEAALILGVPLSATQSHIKEAHRALMLKNHPDKGGSEYLATKINQARDVLLDR